MIGPLRARHRWMTRGLAVIVPLAFAASIIARPAWPTDPSKNGLRNAAPGAAELPAELAPTLLDDLGVSYFVTAAGRLHCHVERGLPRPDVLVYWTADDAPDALMDEAQLLGPLGGEGSRSFLLPRDAATGEAGVFTGSLVFFSLGHGELVATAPVPRAAAPAEDD